MANDPIPKCGQCGKLWDELPASERATPPPCPVCGNEENWHFHVELRGLAHGTSIAEGSIVKVINEGVEITESVGATVKPETFHMSNAFPTPTVYSETVETVEGLPTEVIAEALELGVTLLRPIEGKWPIEVTGFGIVGHVGIGDDLSEALFGASAWIEELATRWEARLAADTEEEG